jgi:hypothetical protein
MLGCCEESSTPRLVTVPARLAAVVLARDSLVLEEMTTVQPPSPAGQLSSLPAGVELAAAPGRAGVAVIAAAALRSALRETRASANTVAAAATATTPTTIAAAMRQSGGLWKTVLA